MKRIQEAFARLKDQKRRAFIPYIMAGDPDLRETGRRVQVLEECGADIIELGVPFSDPLADGPTIQRASERALAAGITLRKVLSFVREIRAYTRIPLVLMTYYNPIFRYGEAQFAADAVAAGVDGVIIPDLPPEEARSLVKLSRRAGLDTIFLIAPTSTEKRVRRIISACSGFVYYVTMTGITGTDLSLEGTFGNHFAMTRGATDKPVAVGFGISTPEDARAMARIADGVIVGSAIVKKFYEDPEGARDFVQELRRAI